MENTNIKVKKTWNKESIYALGAFIAAFAGPWAYLALSDYVSTHGLQLSRWYMGGRRFEPYTTLSNIFDGTEWIYALLAFGFLGSALYFSWKARQRTIGGLERGLLLSELTLVVSVFALLFFVFVLLGALEWL